ncbi:hypothetical protein ANN_17601 [Periplaneta americana]|uniref:Transposase n=1 Tax=Periplaneta americana TaxID=6978 RepID=A0ABQ8STI5_PERAM|nr:hypothetical protein ANN_17601 [Periplaneta americana]
MAGLCEGGNEPPGSLKASSIIFNFIPVPAMLFLIVSKTKSSNRAFEVEKMESKLQEQQKHNELLQERIDLLKEKLLGCSATDVLAIDNTSVMVTGHKGKNTGGKGFDPVLWIEFSVAQWMADRADRQQQHQQLIALVHVGYSESSAAREIGVPLATAKKWAKLFLENNEISNRPIPGRPLIPTREEDAILIKEVENYPFRSVFDLKMASNSPAPH